MTDPRRYLVPGPSFHRPSSAGHDEEVSTMIAVQLLEPIDIAVQSVGPTGVHVNCLRPVARSRRLRRSAPLRCLHRADHPELQQAAWSLAA